VTTTVTQVRALFAQVPDRAPALPQRGPTAFTVHVNGRDLTREEAAAALFEAETDCYGLPDLTTDTLHEVLTASVRKLGWDGLASVAEDFSGLDSGEFFEVGVCRWYAYRLCLAHWYSRARTRPMTAGEATTALYLSDHARHGRVAGAVGIDARQVGRMVRQGADRIPAPALVRIGRTVAADLARVPGPRPAGGWLHQRLMPDYRRARACFDLVRSNLPIPLPVIVRPDNGGLLVGAVPPPGPGNRWARPLRERW
jgi:hypothetical protein